jgi:predicted PurR-regulated permease PerM
MTNRGALLVVAAVVLAAALYFGRDFFVPLTLGMTLAALLAPAVGWLRRRHLPYPAGAAVTVLASLAMIVAAAFALEPPLRGLAAELPRGVSAARAQIERLRMPLARIGIRLQLPTGLSAPRPADSTKLRTPSAAPPGAPAPPGGLPPTPGGAASAVLSTAGRVFGLTTQLVGELVEVLLLAFFLLATGSGWRAKLERAASSEETRRTVTTTVAEIREAIARYVVVTAMINVGQGIVVAVTMWALDLPSPALWGVLTFFFEFVPYLGGLVMVVLLLLVGLASGAGFLHALLGPMAYLVISTIQNNLVSPAAYGRGLRLNPAAILVAVMFWWSLWGITGAFLAVPILAAIHILTTHVKSMRPLGVFLEE